MPVKSEYVIRGTDGCRVWLCDVNGQQLFDLETATRELETFQSGQFDATYSIRKLGNR